MSAAGGGRAGARAGARRALQPRLAGRLVLVLSLAILPLGLISVYQTKKVLRERQSLSESELLERTQRAVADGRAVIRSAMSTAQTLSVVVQALRADRTACTAVMARIVEQSADFVFAGYSDDALGLVCGAQRGGDGAGAPPDDPLAALPEPESRDPGVMMRPLEFLGGVATLSVTVPVLEAGRHRGTVWVVVPVTALNDALARAAPDVDLVLFRGGGEIIATEEIADGRRSVLPEGETLDALAAGGRGTFRGLNRDGMTRDFAVMPVVEGQVFALGSWEPRHRGLVLPAYEEAIALYFPIVMWAIAIGVAYIGVHRLVIRHVHRLRSWMRLYASGRADLDGAHLDHAPEELEVLAESFRAMTRRLSEQDRAREEDLREKTVLLREVHHRVKNNLQLISSMMNMQIRATASPEAGRLLRRVQDRVMALSAIHRALYMARNLSRLRADELLEDIIRQLVIVGSLEETGHRIEVSTELDPIEINPDQSVPLSLLATEAAMNAVKYCGAGPGDSGPWINIALKALEDGQVGLSVVNSRGPAEAEHGGAAGSGAGAGAEPVDGSGLGTRLIESFVAQLDGELDIRDLPERHELHVVFPLVWPLDEDGAEDGAQDGGG